MIVFSDRFFNLFPEYRDCQAWAQQVWRSLPENQKQVTALLCLGRSLTGIGRALDLSRPGAAYHVRQVLKKFQVQDRTALRELLAGWDWGEWEKQYPRE
jgi:DNA-binding NarL/FixJ family response regulator